ncbi:MAG TPA: ASCH domain-containing protein [Longimicrobium sp.]|nr:ASCH domain-containing protein [Longimicrobium sp.]
MKALSIQQPWAWLILHTPKDVENRRWWARYRGDFLIHAPQRFDYGGYKWVIARGLAPPNFPRPDEFERGGIVGRTRIIDCVAESASPWFYGPYGFVLDRAATTPLPFRPLRGFLGFFDVPADALPPDV